MHHPSFCKDQFGDSSKSKEKLVTLGRFVLDDTHMGGDIPPHVQLPSMPLASRVHILNSWQQHCMPSASEQSALCDKGQHINF